MAAWARSGAAPTRQVYDYGAEALLDDLPQDYLVMEYVEGPALSTRIKETGPLGIAEALSVVTQAADALEVAHQAGIVHRDVKPSNLLLRPDDTVVLVDFGVARSVGVTRRDQRDRVVIRHRHLLVRLPDQQSQRKVEGERGLRQHQRSAGPCVAEQHDDRRRHRQPGRFGVRGVVDPGEHLDRPRPQPVATSDQRISQQ